MSILADVLLVAIFVAVVAGFTKYGFTRTMLRIGKAWMSVFTSCVLGPVVAGRLHSWILLKPITSGVHNTLTIAVNNNPNGYNLEELFQNLPDGLIRFLENYNISMPDLIATYGATTEASDEMLRVIAERIATPCSETISQWIGHIVCLLFSFLFFAWLEAREDVFAGRKGMMLDRISGFFIGVLIGCCAAWLIAMFAQLIFQVIVAFDANSAVTDIYQNSYIFKFLNEFDMIGAIKNTLGG